MKLQTKKLQLHLSNAFCSVIRSKYAFIDYDEHWHKFFFCPCCGANPKVFEKPIAFTYDEIMNNFDSCLQQYMNAELNDLNNCYEGVCNYIRESKQKNSCLCKDYKTNHNIEFLQIMVSHWCNLKCAMCTAKEDYKEFSAKSYKQILNNVAKNHFIKKVMLTGKGEPFLYKQELFNLLANTNKDVTTLSNGTLITDKDIDFLERYKDRLEIVLSIDSTVKSVYEKIRIGANFEHVMHILNELLKRNMLYCVNYVYQELNKDMAYTDILWFKERNIPVKILTDYRLVNKGIDLPDNIKQVINTDKGFLL